MLFTLPGVAQPVNPPPVEAAADVIAPAPEPEPLVEISVQVNRLSGDYASAPARVEVDLHLLEPPHQLVRTLSADTNDDGVAVFEVAPRLGLQAFAEVDDGRRFFSEAIEVSTAGERSATVSVYSQTSDPSVVDASSVVTIVELWENYITFTQVFTFNPSQAVIYAPNREDPTSFVRVSVPDDAEGIRVVRPEDDTRVVENEVAFAGEVAPPGVGDHRGPHLIIQYSLPSDNSRTFEWAQELTMDVDRMSVVVPQGSSFARHPEFTVEIDVPMCAAGASGTSMCFDEVTDDPTGVPLREDVDVLVARGNARRGQILRVTTIGWPAPLAWKAPAGMALAGLAVLLFLLLVVRDRTSRDEDDGFSELASLNAQRDALLASAAEVERRLDDGLMLERDAEIARRRIREQLGVVYRRLREAQSPPAE